MKVTRELAFAAARVLTCAPSDCRNEQECFELARYVRAAEKRYGVIELPPEPESEPMIVTDYAPHWECPGC